MFKNISKNDNSPGSARSIDDDLDALSNLLARASPDSMDQLRAPRGGRGMLPNPEKMLKEEALWKAKIFAGFVLAANVVPWLLQRAGMTDPLSLPLVRF